MSKYPKERISVFDILKIGVGPSSSHTMGPWRAAQKCLHKLQLMKRLQELVSLQVHLYGSLAKTGKGHGTDIAVLMGLSGEDPVTCDTTQIQPQMEAIQRSCKINLSGHKQIAFNPATDIVFHYNESLPYHPNGLSFVAVFDDGSLREEAYYSIGGGFVVQEHEHRDQSIMGIPYPCDCADDIQFHCQQTGMSIAEVVHENEKSWRNPVTIQADLMNIWYTMRDCIYRGCHTEGELPGGLQVIRRASRINKKLLGHQDYSTPDEWMRCIRQQDLSFHNILKWISCFALAVNEENAAFGRVVTAPTNGAAGVIPAVLMYYLCFGSEERMNNIEKFLLVAGEIGSIFKKGATISAAMGGCQAEIGVSSAMAAAALTECLGGSVGQALMAAEIAMEHHLGLTCDPIGGLVQIPCIERNSMGAIKAITASNIALESDPDQARVSLDGVIKTMWETALDMSAKYKETSEGGLAVHIPVNVIEC